MVFRSDHRLSKNDELFVHFRRYLYDKDKKIQQDWIPWFCFLNNPNELFGDGAARWAEGAHQRSEKVHSHCTNAVCIFSIDSRWGHKVPASDGRLQRGRWGIVMMDCCWQRRIRLVSLAAQRYVTELISKAKEYNVARRDGKTGDAVSVHLHGWYIEWRCVAVGWSSECVWKGLIRLICSLHDKGIDMNKAESYSLWPVCCIPFLMSRE